MVDGSFSACRSLSVLKGVKAQLTVCCIILHCGDVKLTELKNDIFTHAFFVAGVPAFFRSDDDVCAQRAAEQAFAFASLVADLPSVLGGTLADPVTIVSLTWGSILNSFEGDVTVNFCYDGSWRATWIKDGQKISCAGARIETLHVIGLPLSFRSKPPDRTAIGPEP